MAREKSKAKLRKLNFVNRDRRIEPMKITDKYLLETIESLKQQTSTRRTQYA